MDLELTGKVIIVTGASQGIGHAIARTLGAEGARLVVVARSRGRLEALATAIAGESLVHAIDLMRTDAARGVVAAALERFGRIDGLVNNAGSTKRGDFLALPDRDWDDGFGLKFFGAMRLCREAWPHLQATSGAIVNIAGIGGRTGSAEFAIGGAVNAALLNLTKVLADRGVQDGVRVNAVNPGGVATDRLRTRVRAVADARGLALPDAERDMARELGVARFGQPEEIARVVAFLLSPQAAYCQGAIVDADGGQTRTL